MVRNMEKEKKLKDIADSINKSKRYTKYSYQKPASYEDLSGIKGCLDRLSRCIDIGLRHKSKTNIIEEIQDKINNIDNTISSLEGIYSNLRQEEENFEKASKDARNKRIEEDNRRREEVRQKALEDALKSGEKELNR